MNDKEIELKFKITDTVREKIVEYLDIVAQFKGESRQIDTYYIPFFRDFEVNGETLECIRIREAKDKIILTYKKIHREASPVYCDEYETLVEDKDQLEKILFAIGFEVQMVIDKTRRTYAYNNFEFDFDSVKGLGELMEVELKDVNAGVEDIYGFVGQFGLSAKDVTYDGIQVLMKRASSKGE